jgi:hypothetical protein
MPHPRRPAVRAAGRAGEEAGPTVRDHLWLFACPPVGDAEYLETAGQRGGSRMITLKGAAWLDSPNLLFMP